MNAHRRRSEHESTCIWTWRLLGSSVTFLLVIVIFLRLFDKPREQAEALCIDQRDEAQMMLESVCADPRKRARQVIDHCSRYRYRNETNIGWCTMSTMLTDASLYRVMGSRDVSWTLYIIVFLLGTTMACCVVSLCCASLHYVQSRRSAFALPIGNDNSGYAARVHERTFIQAPSSPPQLPYQSHLRTINDASYCQTAIVFTGPDGVQYVQSADQAYASTPSPFIHQHPSIGYEHSKSM